MRFFNLILSKKLTIKDLIYHFYVLPIFIFIMETSKVNKLFLALMAEVMSENTKKFNYSPQDIIELYCLVREKEDLLQKRKGQMCAAGAVLLLKLETLAVMKHYLTEIYILVAKDAAGAAKLERWYYMYQQDKIKPTKVVLAETFVPKRKFSHTSNKNAALLMGMKKDDQLLQIHKKLTQEGVWKKKKKKSTISEDDMKRFFFVLCLDEYWLKLLQSNLYVPLDVENRLKPLVKNRLSLGAFFELNFQKNGENEFKKWRQAVEVVFQKDISLLEKVVKNAKSEEELLSAYGDFNKFWSHVLPLDGSKNWLNVTSMLGIGVEPESKMAVLEQLSCLEQNNWKAKEDLLAGIAQSNANTIALEAKHFPLLIKEIKKMKQIKRLVVLTKESLSEGAFVLSCE